MMVMFNVMFRQQRQAAVWNLISWSIWCQLLLLPHLPEELTSDSMMGCLILMGFPLHVFFFV